MENSLQEKLDALPERPGVYLWKNNKGDFIYIGKAANLRNRVRGYFSARSQDNHLASQIMRTAAADLEWIVTSNEVEALILEANLVNKHAPRYNILLKDDKHFPYIRVSLSESFPRLAVTRETHKGKDLYFGPYTNSRAMRKTIRYLEKVFRIRDCELSLPLKQPIRPCLSYFLKRCDAPCANLVEPEAYNKGVEEAILLLRGKHKQLRDNLQNRMEAEAKAENFEGAAKLRDQLLALESVQERQRVDLGTEEQPKDLIAAARIGRVGCVVILEVRDGLVSGQKQFEVNSPLEQNESEIITEFIKNYYLTQTFGSIPREILLSHAPLQEENMEGLLREIRGGAVDLEVPQKGEKRKQIHLALENAKLQVSEIVLRREKRDRQNHMVNALREDLQLTKPPDRIEGFDISHLGGTDTVASQVVFINGKPSKKDYRRFNIKTVAGIDDFASMREVLGRRLRRAKEDGKSPDLILIDGGKGQLSAACEAMRNQGLEHIPVIGLAKRLEEVFIPGQSDPLLIPKSSPSLKLLQQVRDEAHRFAVTFQRSKRGRYLRESWLDAIPGVGIKTRVKLLKHFKTPSAILEATREALEGVLGPGLAKKIVAYRENQTETPFGEQK